MIQNPYVSYHIDPRAFRESGIQTKLDVPIEVTPPKEEAESVLKRLRTPFTSPRKPTKPELEKLIRDGMSASKIAEQWQTSTICVQNWIQTYKLNFKKLVTERK